MQEIHHTVNQGDHMSRIAAQYGYADYRSLWDLPENEAIRLKRKDPDVLMPGDVVRMRPRETKAESRCTNQRHHFRLKRQRVLLRLVLRSYDGRPAADAECCLTIEGKVLQLRTDQSGVMEAVIANTAEHGRLKIAAPDVEEADLSIRVGHLDPIDEETGVQGRLNNLGYWCGEIGAAEPAELQSAIEEFQCDWGLAVDGICGPATQERLKEAYGC